MRTLILSLLLLLFVAPAYAQEETETPEDCTEAAQAWYDAIDPENILGRAHLVVIDARASATEKLNAAGSVMQHLATFEELPYPRCIELARYWYQEAVGNFATLTLSLLDGEDATLSMTALMMLNIGQFRGYLAAKGVEIDFRPNVSLYYR